MTGEVRSGWPLFPPFGHTAAAHSGVHRAAFWHFLYSIDKLQFCVYQFFVAYNLDMIHNTYNPLKFFTRDWSEPIWKKKRNSYQLLLPQHQRTYPRGPKSASIDFPPFRPNYIEFSKTVFDWVNLVSQCLHLEVFLLSKFGSESGDFNWCRFWASLVWSWMLW